MKKLFPLLLILLLLLSSFSLFSEQQQSVRDVAISLLEKKYIIQGRNIEFSQVDSLDPDVNGYFIAAIYIDKNEIVRYGSFILNPERTKITFLPEQSGVMSKEMNNLILVDGKVFTDDFIKDGIRINKIGHENYHLIQMEDQNNYNTGVFADSVKIDGVE